LATRIGIRGIISINNILKGSRSIFHFKTLFKFPKTLIPAVYVFILSISIVFCEVTGENMAYKVNRFTPDAMLKTTRATQEAEVLSQKVEFL
jgi:hypothetical protein